MTKKCSCLECQMSALAWEAVESARAAFDYAVRVAALAHGRRLLQKDGLPPRPYCPTCLGVGVLPGMSDEEYCLDCNGTGEKTSTDEPEKERTSVDEPKP